MPVYGLRTSERKEDGARAAVACTRRRLHTAVWTTRVLMLECTVRSTESPTCINVIYVPYTIIKRFDRFRTPPTASRQLPGRNSRLVSVSGAGCDKVIDDSRYSRTIAEWSRRRCVRALGIPGFTDAGVSSAPLERQRYRGNRGPQVACNPSVHMKCGLCASGLL